MKSLKISIIMSVYNAEKYLNQSISSILNQSYRDFEFIIVNDASTDNSLNIIKEFENEDNRIVLIDNDENIGLTKSLNKALKKLKGKYIARHDADDVSLPERLEKQYNFLENNEDIFLCGTDLININRKGVIINNKNTIITGQEKIKTLLQKKNCITHSSIMFRNNGYFYREKFIYAQDYDFYLNLLSNGLKLDNLDEKLILYRNVSNNITISKYNKQEMFAQTANKFFKQRIKIGKDRYDKFDPLKILEMEDMDCEESYYIKQMKLYLEDDDYNCAKKILSEYKKLEGVSFIDSVPYSICINMPYVYKFYRRIYYGDKSK